MLIFVIPGGILKMSSKLTKNKNNHEHKHRTNKTAKTHEINWSNRLQVFHQK